MVVGLAVYSGCLPPAPPTLRCSRREGVRQPTGTRTERRTVLPSGFMPKSVHSFIHQMFREKESSLEYFK